MSRLPIRVRLTAAFALAMAVLLAAVGALLYLRLGSSLDEAIDEGLEARLADMAALAARGDVPLGAGPSPGLADPDESLAQVLDPAGRVVDAAPRDVRPALAATEVARITIGDEVRLERQLPGIEGRARLLATGIESAQGRRVVVVAASLEDRDEALGGFLRQLLVFGPAALALASLLGYALATAALRPVEAIRAEAAAISAAEPGRRLPAPRASDEIARLAETLNEMLERLERALERERSFIADASHELRTPLALLKAELELALRRPRSAAELEGALRSAAAETDRLAHLAEDLLVLARADRGGALPLRRSPVAAGAIIRRVGERFARRAEEAGRRIELDTPDGLRMTVDALRVEQALSNLVANALDHGSGAIRLSALERNGSVELHVTDEGPGFPSAFLPHAFARFTRADRARSAGGVGLGLAIVDVIAQAHGGSAHAANRDGDGADVWVAIPKT